MYTCARKRIIFFFVNVHLPGAKFFGENSENGPEMKNAFKLTLMYDASRF